MQAARKQPFEEDHFFWTHYVVAVLLGLLCVYAALERWQWLSSHPYPLDYDGFYYLHELTYRLSHGTGYYHPVSPFFRALTDLARLFDLAPATALNVWVWGSLFMVSVGLAFIGRTGAWWWLSPALALIVWLSDTLFYLHYGFLRQAGAFALLVTGIPLFRLRSVDRPGPLDAARLCGLVLMVLAATFHPFAGVVGLVSVLCDRDVTGWRWRVAAGLPILAAMLYLSVPKAGQVAASLSLMARPAWETARLAGQITAFEAAEFWIYAAAGAALAATGALSRLRNPLFWVLLALFTAMLLPIWGQEQGGFAFRLARSSPWVLLLALSVALGDEQHGTGARVFTPVLLAALLAALLFARLTLPVGPHPLGPAMAPEVLERHASVLRAWIPEGAFVQAPHGIQYRVTYFLNRPSAREVPRDAGNGAVFAITEDKPAGMDCPPAATVARPDMSHCLKLEKGWYIRKQNQPSR